LIAASDVYEVSAFARQGQWGDRVSLEWTVIALGMTTTGHGPHACRPVQPAGSGSRLPRFVTACWPRASCLRL